MAIIRDSSESESIRDWRSRRSLFLANDYSRQTLFEYSEWVAVSNQQKGASVRSRARRRRALVSGPRPEGDG